MPDVRHAMTGDRIKKLLIALAVIGLVAYLGWLIPTVLGLLQG